jgi:osmotically-inducible protein OsmY
MVKTALQPADQIRKTILDRFYWDSRVDDFSNVDIEVQNEKVTLVGSVPTHASRRFAEIDALSVPGVRTVNNQLHVKFNDNIKIPSDLEVESNIHSILKWNSSIDDSRMKVTVNAGYVILEGTVPSYYQKTRAQELAADVIGVAKLDNRLGVTPGCALADEEIATSAVDMIKKILGADADHLTVMVKKGIITLSGSVPDMIAYHAISNIARHHKGVVDVHNLLTVHEEDRSQ